jgi:hypothetical protein
LSEAGRGIAAVAIRAAEHDILAHVHGRVFDAFMAFHTTHAFVNRFVARLINPIAQRELMRRLR